MQEHDGWVFGDRAFRAGLEPVPSSFSVDRVPVIEELWRRSRLQGPRLSTLLVPRFASTTTRGDPTRLCLLGGLGLAGGSEARATLQAQLRRRSGARGAEEFVFASLAYSRRRVAGTSAQLGEELERRSCEPVEALAASLTAIVLARRHSAASAPLFLEDGELRTLLEALRTAVAPQVAAAQSWRPAQLPASEPRPGTLSEILTRATLLALASRPERGKESELLRVLAWRGHFAELASFVLGRQDGRARAERLEQSGLDVASYLAGCTGIESDLRKRLLQGADAARPTDWRARFWGAAMRLIDAAGRDALLERMLEMEARVDELPRFEAALQEWARRQLFGEPRGEISDRSRQRIGNAARGLPGSLGRVLLWLAGTQSREDRGPVPRLSATIDRYFARGLRAAGTREGQVLWARLQEQRWLHPEGGLASPRGLQLVLLNDIVFDVLARGGDVLKHRWPDPQQAPYLPEGVLPVRDDYYLLLELHLRSYPLFRR